MTGRAALSKNNLVDLNTNIVYIIFRTHNHHYPTSNSIM